MIIKMSGKKITKIIVAGGGFGGVKTALNLAKVAGVEVKLISDNTHFEYHGALYRSAVGHSPMEVVIPLREIFADYENVEIILDSVGYIDHNKKIIASQTGQTYNYDIVVFALGSVVNYFGINGLEENTHTMHDIPSTIKLRGKLIELFKTSANKPCRIAVVGAGASGVELAGEIGNFASFIAKKHNIKPPQAKVILVDGSNRVLPLLSEKASRKAMRKLQELGIEVHLNTRVESCEENLVCLSAGRLDADLIVWTAGSKPSSFYSKNPDFFTLNRNGKVVVDNHMQSQGHKDIYIIGDNADTKYSGMAQTALSDANFISKNIITQLNNGKLKNYRPKKPLYVVTVGPKWAVVENGSSIRSGRVGWKTRRDADLTIFRNFQPYKQAIKTWRHAHRMSKI
jgi:NADH dehydrogenase